MKNYIGLFDNSPYAFDGKNNILEEKDLGICADIASVLTPENSVTALNCFQGCPYTNTSFNINVILNGERVKTALVRLRYGKGRRHLHACRGVYRKQRLHGTSEVHFGNRQYAYACSRHE